MFSKPNKPSSAAARLESPEAARKVLACSLIAENVRVVADLARHGDEQRDGALNGDLKVAHPAIGETGQVEGAITAEAVEIRGRVAGTIVAKTVRLYCPP